MIKRTFENNFFRIHLSTNDKRIAALLEKAMVFKGKPLAGALTVSFQIVFDEEASLAEFSYSYTHKKTAAGHLTTCLSGRIADVTVDEGDKKVTAQVYNIFEGIHPRLIQMLFIDPLVQLLNSQGYHFLHSALLVKDQHCIFVCGSSGSGKSTFSLLMALNGHELITDDKCLFKQDEGIFSFLSIPQKIGVQPHLWRKFSKLRKLRSEMDYDGKRRRIEADAFITRARNKRKFIPQAIFFPEFKDGTKLLAEKLTPQNALERIMSDPNNTYNTARNPKRAGENLFTMFQLTRKIPAFHILYDDTQIRNIPKIIAPLLEQFPK